MELPRDFCAGIGPLQLSVVLVYPYFYILLKQMATVPIWIIKGGSFISAWTKILDKDKLNAELQQTAPDTKHKGAFSTRGR